ncbi:thioredoxin family protein [Helicobacter sp.]|uniref:thioredoxin family protein n=1 Tax=Helicobacter sp. TaxID=218 RepID=UPI0025C54B2D|nr:thioredoxin fold domain-containing protein [Helicobacter sp.]MCI5969173.1 thioredoxin fold domain-containing protein [Helicobacter sp.]MDY2584977.1 thioredoxin fold domain-containing protein [Helicobacter sp.]
MRNFFIMLVVAFGFYGCGDADASAITSGANYTKEQQKAMENVDINSYKEVADVFRETGTITSDGKPYLMVFGANGCVYCDRLKDVVKDNADIKEILKEHYAPYYINISYSKTHFVEFLDKSVQTSDLVKQYNIVPTPTLVFLSPLGKELFVYTGFMPKEKFEKALEFFKNPALQNMESKTIKKAFQEIL